MEPRNANVSWRSLLVVGAMASTFSFVLFWSLARTSGVSFQVALTGRTGLASWLLVALGLPLSILLPVAVGSLASTLPRARALAAATGLCAPLIAGTWGLEPTILALMLQLVALLRWRAGRSLEAALWGAASTFFDPRGLALLGALFVGEIDDARVRDVRVGGVLDRALRRIGPGLVIAVGLVLLRDRLLPPVSGVVTGLPVPLGWTGIGIVVRDAVAMVGESLGPLPWLGGGSTLLGPIWWGLVALVATTGAIDVLRGASAQRERATSRLLVVGALWVLLFEGVSGMHAARGVAPLVVATLLMLGVEGVATLAAAPRALAPLVALIGVTVALGLALGLVHDLRRAVDPPPIEEAAGWPPCPGRGIVCPSCASTRSSTASRARAAGAAVRAPSFVSPAAICAAGGATRPTHSTAEASRPWSRFSTRCVRIPRGWSA